MATLSRVTVDGTTHLIASSAYGYCTSNADTAAKTVTIQSSQDFYLTNGTTVHVYFLNQNTASSPTLNVGGTGAKPIYAYSVDGTNTVKPLWPARSMISFTYNGSADLNGCWSMNDVANGRVGIYELAYNTTVNAAEIKEALNSKRQIILAKSTSEGYEYAWLQNYAEDSEGIYWLAFGMGGVYDGKLYTWDREDGWNTSSGKSAPQDHSSTETMYGLGNASNYGHVKLSNSISSTSSAADGIAATPSAVKAVNDAKAPTSHASSSTTYGVGSYANYGHVKLCDWTTTAYDSSQGYAATPGAVKTVRDLIPTSTDYYILPKCFKSVSQNATGTLTFTSSVYSRGLIMINGYANNVRGMYLVTCTNAGVTGSKAISAAASVAVTTSSNYKITFTNSNSNGANIDFFAFVGGAAWS